MILIYESWKKVLSNPIFDLVSIVLGLMFTIFFAYFNHVTATESSIMLLAFIISITLLLAFCKKDKQDVVEIARRLNKEERYKSALRILMRAQQGTDDDVLKQRLACEMSFVFYSMEEYQQAVQVLQQALEISDTKWTWKIYYQLAKAFSHTDGYYSNKTLDAYLRCAEYRKKYDIYGKEDLQLDIQLYREISEIYRIKKDYTSSNKWFREEMALRYAACDISVKNKIKDLSKQADALAKNNQAEDALRKYEEVVQLIEQHISADFYMYAIIQLKMGSLFCKAYTFPRYEMALECFQKAAKIKRKYILDMPEELFRSFSSVDSEIKEFCRESMADIRMAYENFIIKRNNSNLDNPKELHEVLSMRNSVLHQCQAIIPFMEEVFPDSLELAEIYCIVGNAYKWCPLDVNEMNDGVAYFEKTEKIWRRYKDNQEVQTKLANMLVDLGGLYVMQKDYDTAVIYRLEALKIISSVKKPDINRVVLIELSLKLIYKYIKWSKTIEYDHFLEKNGLSSVIESLQFKSVENGCDVYELELRGIVKEFNREMTKSPED